MWPNEPLAFSRHQVVYIHSKGGGVWAGGGEMAKERKRKTLPLCRMKFSLTEKTKVIVAWQAGWLWGRIANGDGTENGVWGCIRQVSSEKFSTCANWTHVTKFANKFHKLRNFPRIRNANEMRAIVDKPRPRRVATKWKMEMGKCRWQMKMPM